MTNSNPAQGWTLTLNSEPRLQVEIDQSTKLKIQF